MNLLVEKISIFLLKKEALDSPLPFSKNYLPGNVKILKLDLSKN